MSKTAIIFSVFLLFCLQFTNHSHAQFVQVGEGSYTTNFPGKDVAGRNDFPSGTPQFSGNALGKPVPTNDWWSALTKNGTAGNLFNYPFTMKTVSSGLVVSYIPFGVINDQLPVTVGVSGLNAGKTTVSDYSDWTVSMNWKDGARDFTAVSGIGMPFIYFTKASTDIAVVKITTGTVTVSNEMLVITNAQNGADFAIYAPAGSSWTKSGDIYSSNLNGKNYWSLAFIPLTASNITAVATEYKKYAYVFPVNTVSEYSYDEATSVLRTDFSVTTDVKEGTETNILLGLLPHQWANLASDSPVPDKYSYETIRGEMKTMAGNSFSVENTYYGILPTLPYLNNYSPGFSPTGLSQKIFALENESLATWTDSYNDGQVLNRLIQTARIADEMGNTVARDKMLATIKERLEDWLTAESGEIAFIFYYNTTWTALLGYPAGHGQDGNINDHHFHWGYFIHAAAFLEQYEPGWADRFGEMVNLLVRDAASVDRNDDLFPYLRSFSPYAGHCWANGFATFPNGNDQESTSESMQFNSSLIHWGEITGNKEIRDLGIYLYTTEQTAIEEYWFDIHERNFPPSQAYSLVSRLWGNSFDNGTFWTSDIAASYGIELYPVHGGSLYLGHDSAYVAKLWNEMKENTGIMNNEENPNLWHDVYWAYLALIDPSEAIELYDSYPDRELKFGISDAQTYHWLHALNALGRVDATITANYPIAMAFKQNGEITYVAHNYSKDTITVKFSSGYELVVPANKLVTSRDIEISGVLSSSFDQAFPGGSVQLSLEVSDGTPTKIEFMDGDELLGEDTTGPWSWKAENLSLGIHNLYARIYIDDKFNVSNTVNVIVGSQIPYGGTAWPIPGIIESGKYDTFEGGKGQNISYLDISPGNSGNFRPDESVDATLSSSQGAFVHHISANEWLEYTVNVEQSGLYSLALSYASGNSSGGGPFNLLIDGKAVVSGVTVASTSSTSWDVWSAKTLTEIPLVEGEHILRLEFTRGEFNPGKMTFTRTGEIPYTYPIASAGPDIKVLWPLSTAVLNGTASSESGDRSLDYKWMQVYGPSIAEFSDISIPEPGISGLVEGMYRFKLIVTNPDLRTSEDEVMVAVSKTENIAPYISLTSPSKDVSYPEGEEITLTAVASDFDGNIQQVEFYQNDSLISADTSKPYSVNWTEAAGEYVITAKAVDNEGGVSVSQARKVTFLPVFSCLGFSSAAQNGTFSVGYKYTFETIGSDVRITFELYDDQPGLIAYLWMESPFEEKDMKDIGDKKFSTILSNQIPGSTISVACKFAYSGGFSATKYISYVVGDDCADDNQIPVDFTATLGEVTPTSIQLLLNAVDNSGTIIYNITRGGSKKTITANSGVLTSYVVTALNPNTNYSFSIEAFDITGNAAISNPVSLSVKTLVSTNTACKGESSQASVGSFETGYNYEFLTSGKNVIVNFELLDNKSGVIAYLWNTTSGFTETDMTNAGGKKFSITLPNQTPGSVLKLACKFAFAGGLSVTKTYSYTVGDHCFPTEVKPNMETGAVLYPNPVKDILKLKMNSLPDANEELFLTVYDNRGKILKTIITRGSEDISIDLSGFTEGMYFIKAQTELNVFVWKVIKK